MNLKDDLTVETSDGVKGNWMPFYDQAFKVELDNGMRFITNYRYSLKDYITKDPLESGTKLIQDLQTDDYNKFNSECDKTMIGFV